MVHVVTLPNGYEVSDDRTRLDMDLIHNSLAGAYWAAGRPRAQTERSWANCLCCCPMDACDSRRARALRPIRLPFGRGEKRLDGAGSNTA